MIAKIDEFKGAWRALGTLAPDRLSALRRVATIESIGSSTRIEGSKLSDREVQRLLSNLQIKKFNKRDEQEVAGYAEVMDLVFSSWQDITLTENHIKQLHRDLLIYSEKDTRHRRNYKTSSNSVVAFDENGSQIGVVFETATPFDTPRMMAELMTWMHEERAKERLHPLLLVAVWVVVFLESHPFQDGNGRLSRVLTTLLLLSLRTFAEGISADCLGWIVLRRPGERFHREGFPHAALVSLIWPTTDGRRCRMRAA